MRPGARGGHTAHYQYEERPTPTHPERRIKETFTIQGRLVSLSTQPEEPQVERPPDYGDYRPPRTTAEGGATMLLSGVFLAGAIVTLGLAVYTKLADVNTFGQIMNLLLFAVALLLVALYLLVWEITLRLIARSDD